jgi:putative membrane protein
MQHSHNLAIGSAVLVLLLVVSGIRRFDQTTWVLEIFPILIAMPVLWITHRRFPLTNLLYVLIFCHAVILIIGGAYSYARVPLGFQIQDMLHLSRNPYDKIGHFFQGFVPALIVREIFIRSRYVKSGKMVGLLVICVALAISATYELIEWGAAIWLGQGADEFLGTQGDPWDTQSDMFFALFGSVTAIFTLSRIHDAQITRISNHDSQQPNPAVNTNAER